MNQINLTQHLAVREREHEGIAMSEVAFNQPLERAKALAKPAKVAILLFAVGITLLWTAFLAWLLVHFVFQLT
jgi:hypothetical protein